MIPTTTLKESILKHAFVSTFRKKTGNKYSLNYFGSMRKTWHTLLVGKVRRASMFPSNLCSCLGGWVTLSSPGLAVMLLTHVIRHLADTSEPGPVVELFCPPVTLWVLTFAFATSDLNYRPTELLSKVCCFSYKQKYFTENFCY